MRKANFQRVTRLFFKIATQRTELYTVWDFEGQTCHKLAETQMDV